MSDCRQCVDFDWCAEHEDCGLFKQKPITNADRIRAMSDEELAEWFGKIQYDTAYYCAGEYEQHYPYPADWLDWLRQEATDVN